MATTHTHAASPAALLKKPCYSEPLTNTNKHKIKMSQNYESDNTRLDSGRAAIFVDGSNLFYAALQLGIEIDYTKLLTHLTANARLLRAFFYTGVDRTNEKQQGFLLWMRRNGYRVITKDLIQLPDGSKKANLDVEIAVDMLTLADHVDTAILVSGDGDLAYAVNAIAYRGVRVSVVSLRSMTSDHLINVADHYIDLDTIKQNIQKPTASGYPDYIAKMSL
ncbi:MAG: NYN domain-containing protein [Elainella sp. C42_A2020_010]|nr:NYN domain-containing protein [Elainella sp. C42_A2020_010]